MALHTCRIQSLEGIRLFTTSGYKYYRMFQISLCGSGSDDAAFPLATCFNNATSDLQVCNRLIEFVAGETANGLAACITLSTVTNFLLSHYLHPSKLHADYP
jgi:hypothetical protein